MDGDYTSPEGAQAGLNLSKPPSQTDGRHIGLNLRFVWYHPPVGNRVGLNLEGAYTPPVGHQIGLDFTNDPDGPPQAAEAQYLHPAGIVSGEFGDTLIPVLRTFGWQQEVVGTPTVYNYFLYLAPKGFSLFGIGRPTIKNVTDQLFPASFVASGYGTHHVENWERYLEPSGYVATEFFDAYVQGGVKYVEPPGLAALATGKPTVINTTADQTARPSGIPWPGAGTPDVDPKTLRAAGFHTYATGFPLVQRPPYPLGWRSSVFGYPVVDYKTKYLEPSGFEATEVFVPDVRDRAQTVRVSSLVRSAVFGDIAVRSSRRYIETDLFDVFASSPWSEIVNTRRLLALPGFIATQFGTTDIANAAPNLTPSGWDSFSHDYVLVAFAVRYVRAHGWDSRAVPSGLVVERTPSIEPVGFAGATGKPTVWFHTRTLWQVGADHQEFGDATVWHYRRAAQIDGFASDRYSDQHRVEHEVRYIDAHGAPHMALGTPQIEWRNRTIEPPSIWEEFPSAHMIGWPRTVTPLGFEATRWGTRIIPEVKTIHVLNGIAAYRSGVATIGNHDRAIVITHGITTGVQPADRWGRATVYNLLQFIATHHDHDTGLMPPEWPRWTLIENRNKQVGAIGNVMTRYGRAYVYNNARLLEPPGIDPGADPGAFLVAYRVRELPIPGMPSPYIPSWTVVYNRARVLPARGAAHDEFGTATIESNRRTYSLLGWDDFGRGFPMVSFAVRELTFESRYGIAPPGVSSQNTVHLHTRYITAAGGINSYQSGGQSLRIFRATITPRWTHVERFGFPTARNLTPELHTYGRNHQEFGVTAVRLEFRFVQGAGAVTAIVPSPVIAFRDRQFQAFGFNSMRVGDKLVVTRTGSGAYGVQFIDLSMYTGANAEPERLAEGHGIWPPGGRQHLNVQVPPPALNQQVIYPQSDEPMTRYGDAVVTSNVIRVSLGIANYDPIGSHRVESKIRYIRCDPDLNVYKPIAPDPREQVPKQRVSPHTIYAVMESPQQARDNHPLSGGRHLHYVDGYIRAPGVRFGQARVMLRDRPIAPAGIPWVHTIRDFVHPNPTVRNARHYIHPPGIRSWQFGWPEIPGPRTIEQAEASDTAVFGTPTVAPPPYVGPQDILPKVLDAAEFGQSRVELFNREVNAHGWASQALGQGKPNDQPFMWQGLRVGPHVPMVVGGDDTSLYGDNALVAFRVREVRPEGFDGFASEYDIADFGERMRVMRREEHVPIEFIMTHGAQHDRLGVPDVRNRVHYIIPDGNAETYRKGAHHA